MKVRVRLKDYDWIVLNTSGGKDSQTMVGVMADRCAIEGVPKERLVGVHCDLAEEEWPGTRELAQKQVEHYGIRFGVVKREQGSILEHVLDRHEKLQAKGKDASPFPSSDNRWCTSDHKRDQVSKLLTELTEESRSGASPWPSNTARYCTSHHKQNQVSKLMTKLAREKGRPVRILNCMGMRSAESNARSKLLPFRLDKRNTNGRRTVHIYLPIFDWSAEEVWDDIKARGIPHHRAYDLGMPRLSCCFCIFATRDALLLAGHHNPNLLRKYVEVEKRVGSKFRVNLALADVLADVEAGVQPTLPIRSWEM